MVILAMCLSEASASTYLLIEKADDRYSVSVWSHTDGVDDLVTTVQVDKKDLSPIEYYVDTHKKITAIYKKGVFEVLKYGDGQIKRWAALSNGEKDMTRFLSEKFDVSE